MQEYFFFCPHCWQEISILIDTSVTTQRFIEDCEVCCNPLEIKAVVEQGEVRDFTASAAQ